MNWTERLQRIGKNTEIARKVMRAWADDDPRKKKIKASSLATYIGKLKKGDETWWRDRANAGARSALAYVLEDDEFDLFPRLGREALAEWASPEFPALPPLDPAEEKVVDATVVHVESWPDNRGRLLSDLVTSHPRGLFWVEVPDGGGKSFALRLARERRQTTLQATTLTDAATQVDGCPVVIEVARRDSSTDLRALARLAQHKNVMVLAPFPMPRPDEAQQARSGAQAFPPLGWLGGPVEAEDGQWTEYVTAPHRGQRGEFVRWVVGRAPAGSLLEGQTTAVLAWLEEFDPEARHFSLPSDLLWLLARMHHESVPGVRRLETLSLVKSLLDERAARVHADDAQLATWLREDAMEAFIGICNARWRELGVDLLGPLQTARWRMLVPDDYCSPMDIQRLQAELEAAEPGAIHDVLKRSAAPRRRAVVERLMTAGLLVPVGDDQLVLGPPWLREAMTEHAVEVSVAAPGALAWGRLCFDPERRDRVDRALKKLAQSNETLESHLAALPAHPEGPDEVGAVDGWFVAVGARFRLEQTPESEGNVGCSRSTLLAANGDLLKRLFEAEVGALVPYYSNSPLPVSLPRMAHAHQDDGTHGWLVAAWAWSFGLPDGCPVPPGLDWYFPGWSRPDLASLPAQLPTHGAMEFQFINWLADLASPTLNQPSFDSRHYLAGTAWVLAKLWRGEAIPESIKPENVGRDIVARAVNQWEPSRRDPAVRVLADFTFGRSGHVVSQLAQWQRGAWKELLAHMLAHAEVDTFVSWLQQEDGYRPGDLRHLISNLPEKFHLAVIRHAEASRPKDVEDFATFVGFNHQEVSADALEWLALRAGPHNQALRHWVACYPERAWAVLRRVGLAHALASPILYALPARLCDDILAWLERASHNAPTGLVRMWSLRAISRRPDLIDPLWALHARLAGS